MGREARVRRRTASSSTPWRKKTAATGDDASGSPATAAVSRDRVRFLNALETELMGSPLLCSCGRRNGSSAQCANNCALYKQPRKKEKLLASVFQQGAPAKNTPLSSTGRLLLRF